MQSGIQLVKCGLIRFDSVEPHAKSAKDAKEGSGTGIGATFGVRTGLIWFDSAISSAECGTRNSEWPNPGMALVQVPGLAGSFGKLAYNVESPEVVSYKVHEIEVPKLLGRIWSD